MLYWNAKIRTGKILMDKTAVVAILEAVSSLAKTMLLVFDRKMKKK